MREAPNLRLFVTTDAHLSLAADTLFAVEGVAAQLESESGAILIPSFLVVVRRVPDAQGGRGAISFDLAADSHIGYASVSEVPVSEFKSGRRIRLLESTKVYLLAAAGRWRNGLITFSCSEQSK